MATMEGDRKRRKGGGSIGGGRRGGGRRWQRKRGGVGGRRRGRNRRRRGKRGSVGGGRGGEERRSRLGRDGDLVGGEGAVREAVDEILREPSVTLLAPVPAHNGDLRATPRVVSPFSLGLGVGAVGAGLPIDEGHAEDFLANKAVARILIDGNRAELEKRVDAREVHPRAAGDATASTASTTGTAGIA